jgi:hypothetical protein
MIIFSNYNFIDATILLKNVRMKSISFINLKFTQISYTSYRIAITQ